MLVLWLTIIKVIGAFIVKNRNNFLISSIKCDKSIDNYPFSSTPTPINTLDIHEGLKTSLIDNGYKNLTLIQEKSIPKIIGNDFHNIFIHSETGSGKTLSYAIPLVHLYRTLYSDCRENAQTPVILVIVPSRLLESQALNVFKQILQSNDECQLARNLGKSRTLPPIVIGTIDNVSQIFRIFTDNFKVDPLQTVKIVVYDEVDFLVQQQTSKALLTFIKKMPQAKTILCGATINNAGKNSILRFLNRFWKKIEWIESEFVHVIPPTITIDFHETEHSLSSKVYKTIELCKESDGPKMIFCQSQATAAWLHDNLPLQNKHLLKDIQLNKIDQLGDNRIIISTDHRGFDSYFSHVIHFDFPQDILQLIHRSGRAGRAGNKGRVSFLVTERSRDFYNEVKRNLSSGDRLDQLFSRKRSLAKKRKKKRITNENDSLSNII